MLKRLNVCLAAVTQVSVRYLGLVVLAAVTVLASSARATSTAFDLGTDPGTNITDAAGSMGTVLGVIFGVFIALCIFGAFWRWGRRGVKGS